MWGTGRKQVGELLTLLSGIGLITPNITTASAGVFGNWVRRSLLAKEAAGFPRGGTSQVIDTLSEKINESGKITDSSKVKSINIEKGKAKSVKVRDKDIECKALVFAVPVQKLSGLVGDSLPADYLEKCDSIVPTAGISIDLCLDEKVSDIDGLIVSSDPVTMGQFTSNIDPETAPEGKQLCTFYYPLPVEAMDDKKLIESEENRFTALVEKMFPGIMEKVSWQRVLKLMMVDGYEPRVGQTAKDRPAVRVPGVDNLFLAGDSVSAPGTGGDVAFDSAVEAAAAVQAFLK